MNKKHVGEWVMFELDDNICFGTVVYEYSSDKEIVGYLVDNLIGPGIEEYDHMSVSAYKVILFTDNLDEIKEDLPELFI